MEIKIGIKESGRELVLESAQSAEKIAETVRTALAEDHAVLDLTDERGRQFLIAARALAYVEIGAQEVRKIGFIS